MEEEMASLVMPPNLVEESSVPPNLVEESSESSSIGAASPDCSDEEEEQEVVVESKRNEGSFGSLESLEDALPIKRGLSNFFPGKSKSFANLSDAAGSSAEDLFKHENPFNKRRRLLMMSTMRRASYASLVTAGSSAEDLFKHENPFNKRRRLLMMSTMRRASYASLVTAAYQTVEEADEEEESSSTGSSSSSLLATPLNLHGSDYNFKKRREFTSPRCFSLSDLRHEENS